MTLIAMMSLARAEAAAWSGEWGLDPSQSDEPTPIIQRAYTGPVVTGQGASRYSPDGGAIDHEAERNRVVYEALDLLGISGRLSLSAAPTGGVALGWGDGVTYDLPSGKRWTKVEHGDDRFRIRVTDLGEQLRIERRAKLTTITETLIPSEGGELVAVVRVDGSTLSTGVEFRRVYRRLE